MAEADDALCEFLDGLPTTIRDLVIGRCCLALRLLKARPLFDAPPLDRLLWRHLESQEPVYRASDLAHVIGTIEIVLEPDLIDRETLYRGLDDQDPSPDFNLSALESPLRSRHFASARERFRELRTGDLSPSSLRRFHELQALNNPLPPPRT
jgi:hypothetical protein